MARRIHSEFEAFYRDAKDPCFRALLATVGSAQEADDLLAESFTRALSRWSELRRHPRPEAWVVRTALNLHRDRWRRSQRQQRLLQRREAVDHVDVVDPALMAAVQEIAARIGRVTGAGLGAAMRDHAPRWLTVTVITALVAANIFNLGADLAAMVEVAHLATGTNHAVAWLLGIAGFSLLLEVLVPFDRYAPILKLLTLALLSYAGVLFVVAVPWDQVWRGALALAVDTAHGRNAGFDLDTGLMVCAIFGTTISPYLFFWQASHEAEDEALEKVVTPKSDSWRTIRFDTIVGMLFSNVVMYFIILSTAATLHRAGPTDIQSAAQAAEAEPLPLPQIRSPAASGALPTKARPGSSCRTRTSARCTSARCAWIPRTRTRCTCRACRGPSRRTAARPSPRSTTPAATTRRVTWTTTRCISTRRTRSTS